MYKEFVYVIYGITTDGYSESSHWLVAYSDSDEFANSYCNYLNEKVKGAEKAARRDFRETSIREYMENFDNKVQVFSGGVDYYVEQVQKITEF